MNLNKFYDIFSSEKDKGIIDMTDHYMKVGDLVIYYDLFYVTIESIHYLEKYRATLDDLNSLEISAIEYENNMLYNGDRRLHLEDIKHIENMVKSFIKARLKIKKEFS